MSAEDSIRKILEKALNDDHAKKDFGDVLRKMAAAGLPSTTTAKCRACGQKNRWTTGRSARCGKCGLPLQ